MLCLAAAIGVLAGCGGYPGSVEEVLAQDARAWRDGDVSAHYETCSPANVKGIPFERYEEGFRRHELFRENVEFRSVDIENGNSDHVLAWFHIYVDGEHIDQSVINMYREDGRWYKQCVSPRCRNLNPCL